MAAGMRLRWVAVVALAACDGTLEEAPTLVPLLRGHPGAARARLVGDGSSSCSTVGAAGERWCAFSLPGHDERTELWVMNVARREAPRCDGTSPHCLRLTENLWTGDPLAGPTHPFAHRFDGTTLVFHADAHSRPNDLYQGPVWAWRPGWAAPRPITTAKGLTCVGHARAAVAFCLDDASIGRQIEFDLLAGPLVDGPASELSKVTRISPLRPNDASAWRAAFSPDGDRFAFSAVDASSGREALRVARTAEVGRGPLEAIALDSAHFRIAHDGRKVYYLRGYNYSVDGNPSGTLMMADFPSGENAVELVGNIGAFFLLGDETAGADRGLAVFQDMVRHAGRFRLLVDRSRPSEILTVEENVGEATVSPDGRFSAYVRSGEMGVPDLVIAANDGSGAACLVNAKRGYPAFGLTFLPRSGLMFWAEESSADDVGNEGWLALTDGCSGKRRFGTNLEYLRAIGDGVLLYGESTPGMPGMTLSWARLPGGRAWPESGGQGIRGGADGFVGVLAGSAAAHVLFQVNQGPEEERGLYLYGPITDP